jgi:hypothetical protein
MTYQTNVSRGEEALFGPMAAAMRHLAGVVANIEDAQAEVVTLVEQSRDADEFSVNPSIELDDMGRSEGTRWLIDVFERINDYHRKIRVIYQDVAGETLDRWSDKALESSRTSVGRCRPFDDPPMHYHGDGASCDCGRTGNTSVSPVV